jgi:hypothetical protein
VSISVGYNIWKLAFEISPIVLTGGIATNIPGGALPIVALTEPLNFLDGLLSGGADLGLDDFFAHWLPLPGSSYLDQQIGQYPFANQAVAANAVIRQPLQISMRMICPAKDELGWAIKLATISALVATLAQHNASGGTYTIATPSYFYTNCVMRGMRDTANAASKQPQNTFQFDFEQPLLTLQDAEQAYNNLMGQLANGQQTTATSGALSWSGLSPTVGNPPSLGTVGLVPSASNTAAAGTAGVGVGPNQASGP